LQAKQDTENTLFINSWTFLSQLQAQSRRQQMQMNLNAKNFTLKLSLESQETLERQFLVKTTSKKVLS